MYFNTQGQNKGIFAVSVRSTTGGYVFRLFVHRGVSLSCLGVLPGPAPPSRQNRGTPTLLHPIPSPPDRTGVPPLHPALPSLDRTGVSQPPAQDRGTIQRGGGTTCTGSGTGPVTGLRIPGGQAAPQERYASCSHVGGRSCWNHATLKIIRTIFLWPTTITF